ncbi:MAG: hypothetical protein WC188_04670 [Candidatus Caldatribacteriota bacterium]|nr:hypothetical protein [Patescibacteria group bacterium]
MLTLSYFSKFPSVYKDREPSVKEVSFVSIEAERTENKTIFIRSSTGKYKQEIEIFDKDIHLNSPCKVFCSCESFKYEFANSIFRSGSLLQSISFIRSIVSRPKKKNEYNIVSGCKHLVALSRQATKIKLKKLKEE